MFKTFDEDKNDTLEYNEFKKMLDHLRKKEELTNLFKQYKKDGSEIIQAQQLHSFFKSEQDQNVSLYECQIIIQDKFSKQGKVSQ